MNCISLFPHSLYNVTTLQDYLYTHLELGVDTSSRVALVGPNGAGKSTLLKLMLGHLSATEGMVSRRIGLQISYYNQHSEEQLDMDLNPIQFLQKTFKDGIIPPSSSDGIKIKPEVDQWRRYLGMYGVTGDRQTDPISTMSDGLKTRVVFCMLSLQHPHILVLDEPTNHLDMDCIMALAAAINRFQGGLVLVSHDFRLLNEVAKEIWVCDEKTIKPWRHEGGIKAYKDYLRKQGDDALEEFKQKQGGKSK